MESALSQTKVAVLGGDQRDAEVITTLIQQGARVVYFGCPESSWLAGATRAKNPIDAVRGAKVVILPVTGTDAAGNLRTTSIPITIDPELVSAISPDAAVFIGSLKPVARALFEGTGLKVVEYAEDDELAILNSIPSAEGAIQIAMEETPFTIHGSTCLVLGFGRCGMTIARMVHGIGAKTIVAARKPKDLARVFEMGFRPVEFSKVASVLGESDIIFNTVPLMVLPRELLLKTNPEAVIVDIASPPGGVDFAAAKDLGIKAVLAPGLPGKVAPRTAGKILAGVMLRLIDEALGGQHGHKANS